MVGMRIDLLEKYHFSVIFDITERGGHHPENIPVPSTILLHDKSRFKVWHVIYASSIRKKSYRTE